MDACLYVGPSDRMTLERLIADGKTPQRGWFWQMQELPDAPESRYLYPILAGNDFQEGLKNYRDLRLMQSNLSRWADSLAAFGAMIEARDAAALAAEAKHKTWATPEEASGLPVPPADNSDL